MEIKTKEFVDIWKADLKDAVEKLTIKPSLLVVMAKNYSEPSKKYVFNKIKVAEELGIEVIHYEMEWRDLSKESLLLDLDNVINKYPDSSVIVQLPFPKLSAEEIAELIPPDRDVDGFTDEQKGRLVSGKDNALIPCTALGIVKLLKYLYDGNLKGKTISILNRSNLIGKPLMQLALQNDMTPTVIHSRSCYWDKSDAMSNDIIVTGCGKRAIFDAWNISSDSVETIIDCSMERKEGIAGVGDFDKESILNHYPDINIASGYGHTGLLTTTALYENVIKAHKLINKQ